MMTPIKNFIKCDEVKNDNAIITCPSCGEDYTHGVGMEYIEREEDAKKGNRITVRGGLVSKSTDAITHNMSERRGSMLLRFSCEQGCDDFIISFYQHKGITFFDAFVLKGQGNTWLRSIWSKEEIQ
jgi:hypothetical protein